MVTECDDENWTKLNTMEFEKIGCAKKNKMHPLILSEKIEDRNIYGKCVYCWKEVVVAEWEYVMSDNRLNDMPVYYLVD